MDMKLDKSNKLRKDKIIVREEDPVIAGHLKNDPIYSKSALKRNNSKTKEYSFV